MTWGSPVKKAEGDNSATGAIDSVKSEGGWSSIPWGRRSTGVSAETCRGGLVLGHGYPLSLDAGSGL